MSRFPRTGRRARRARTNSGIGRTAITGQRSLVSQGAQIASIIQSGPFVLVARAPCAQHGRFW
jgi:hypothetical protein